MTSKTSRVYVDTNVVIRVMEHTDEASAAIAGVFQRAVDGELRLVTSELTLSEALVVPVGQGDDFLAQAYGKLLHQSELFDLRPITQHILIEAAYVRARRTLQLPDAIHVATAEAERCGLMLSFDRRLQGSGAFDVIGPSDPRVAAGERSG
ncbi:MAG: type II toxin-antitoxin system VapC family toxin [Hyphomicrobiales bacterium]